MGRLRGVLETAAPTVLNTKCKGRENQNSMYISEVASVITTTIVQRFYTSLERDIFSSIMRTG